MSHLNTSSIAQLSQLKDLVADLDQVLGADGNFWGLTTPETFVIESPDQVKDLATDLLVKLFGLEVRGL